MWKVKRMNTARIVVLTIAVGAGGIAGYLASGSDEKPAQVAPVAQLQTVDILVAKSAIAPASRSNRRICNGRPGRPRPPAAISSAAPARQTRSRKSPARSRARRSSRVNRSGSRSWCGPTVPVSWRRSCRRLSGYFHRDFAGNRRLAAPFSRTTASTIFRARKEPGPGRPGSPTRK